MTLSVTSGQKSKDKATKVTDVMSHYTDQVLKQK